MINLVKDQKINLTKQSRSVLTNVRVGLGWVGKGRRDLDLDSFVALKDAKGVSLDFIYFSNRHTTGIKHNGDDLVGGGSASSINESIDIDLTKVSPEVNEIICGLFIYSGANSLNQVNSAFINIANGSENLVQFDIKKSFGNSKSVLVGKFVRNGADWDFISTGIAMDKGFIGIRNMYSRGRTADERGNSSQSRGWFAELIDAILDFF